MHVGRGYSVWMTLRWSQRDIWLPAAWATAITAAYVLLEFDFLAVPWLPMSAIAIAVAFYLGFKNSASYDRVWEARKIWGAIVNASRSWAFTARDLVSDVYTNDDVDAAEIHAIHTEMVLRHVAWMDAFRHQLRKVKSWEHPRKRFDKMREAPEYGEDLTEVLGPNISDEERKEVLSQINPAVRLLSNQSRRLSELRRRGLLDGFAHFVLQQLLHELMTQQGKAERIKNFPFPRQYATVNRIFAIIFALLVPFGMLHAFSELGEGLVWLSIPFSTIVSWVFLTTDRIGDWSENPFEGLSNDVPISQIARGIERDIRQMVDQKELPPAREPNEMQVVF